MTLHKLMGLKSNIFFWPFYFGNKNNVGKINLIQHLAKIQIIKHSLHYTSPYSMLIFLKEKSIHTIRSRRFCGFHLKRADLISSASNSFLRHYSLSNVIFAGTASRHSSNLLRASELNSVSK